MTHEGKAKAQGVGNEGALPTKRPKREDEAVRAALVAALEADLVGPFDPASGHEVLPLPPSRWYLTGFLAPQFGRAPEARIRTPAVRVRSRPASNSMIPASPASPLGPLWLSVAIVKSATLTMSPSATITTSPP